jgi:hypothetical protein
VVVIASITHITISSVSDCCGYATTTVMTGSRTVEMVHVQIFSSARLVAGALRV